MKNDDKTNNYVIPKKVDLSKVQVDHDRDNTLSRERDNIISASVQANKSINKHDATIINDSIKVKKKHPIHDFCITILLLVFAFVVPYMIVKTTRNFVNDKTETTTSTTTTSKVNVFSNYLTNFNIARKFKDEGIMLILLPKASLFNTYLLIETDDNGIINKEIGSYTLSVYRLKLIKTDSVDYLNVLDEAINYGENNLTIDDDEMKYYKFEDGQIVKLLFINDSNNADFAYYEEIDGTDLVGDYYEYEENDNSIILSNGAVFTKDGSNLIYNDYTYTIGS